MSSKLELSKGNGFVRNATFVYTKLQDATGKHTLKYGSETMHEYSVEAVVDEDCFDDWNENFPKNSPKVVKTAEFEGKYRIAPPFPEAKKQYIIKFKADAQFSQDMKDKSDPTKTTFRQGDYIPYEWSIRPKVFVPVEGGVEDITADKLVSNGSVGDVAFTIKENDYGKFPKISAILVTDLIEYEASGGGAGGSAFGSVIGESKAPAFDAPVQEAAVEETPAAEEAAAEDFDSEDLPF